MESSGEVWFDSILSTIHKNMAFRFTRMALRASLAKWWVCTKKFTLWNKISSSSSLSPSSSSLLSWSSPTSSSTSCFSLQWTLPAIPTTGCVRMERAGDALLRSLVRPCHHLLCFHIHHLAWFVIVDFLDRWGLRLILSQPLWWTALPRLDWTPTACRSVLRWIVKLFTHPTILIRHHTLEGDLPSLCKQTKNWNFHFLRRRSEQPATAGIACAGWWSLLVLDVPPPRKI